MPFMGDTGVLILPLLLLLLLARVYPEVNVEAAPCSNGEVCAAGEVGERGVDAAAELGWPFTRGDRVEAGVALDLPLSVVAIVAIVVLCLLVVCAVGGIYARDSTG